MSLIALFGGRARELAVVIGGFTLAAMAFTNAVHQFTRWEQARLDDVRAQRDRHGPGGAP